MVKVMSAPVIAAFCVLGIVMILLNRQIDSFDAILLLLVGVLFEELRRYERHLEKERALEVENSNRDDN